MFATLVKINQNKFIQTLLLYRSKNPNNNIENSIEVSLMLPRIVLLQIKDIASSLGPETHKKSLIKANWESLDGFQLPTAFKLTTQYSPTSHESYCNFKGRKGFLRK